MRRNIFAMSVINRLWKSLGGHKSLLGRASAWIARLAE